MQSDPLSGIVLMVAGGTGTRMGTSVPKQFLPLHGKPVIAHTFTRFRETGLTLRYCLVLFPSLFPQWEAIRSEYLPWLDETNLVVAEGGAERTDSVSNGLERMLASGWLEEGSPLPVFIHDAVRPLVAPADIMAAHAMALDKGNAVVCVPVKSSMRRRTGEGSVAVNRDEFFHVQTPQVFRFHDLLRWYRNRPHNRFTDDASLAEHFGCAVQISPGSYDNIKITTREDMGVAEGILDRENHAGE